MPEVLFSNAQIDYLETLGLKSDVLNKIINVRAEELRKHTTWGIAQDVHQFDFGPDRNMTVIEYIEKKALARAKGGEEVTTMYHCPEISRGSNSLLCLILHYITEKKLGKNSSALVYGMVRALEIDKEVTDHDHM